MISQSQFLRLSVVAILAMNFLVPASARADGNCDSALSSRLDAFEHLADSIRVDKPGLARVYARDGTEFSAGQALWMKGQLREVSAACTRGDRGDATKRVDAVAQLLQAHTHQNL